MKYSRSAITQLTRWYRQVLIKCAIFNAAVFVGTISLPVTADATDINQNGVPFQTATTIENNNPHIFNISTTTTNSSGNIGVNTFGKFNISNGDTANLNLINQQNKLVNLVFDSSASQIDGIVNSYKNGQIGGDILFANPNGFVVGKTGVFNVGSLTMMTPTEDTMKKVFSSNSIDNDTLDSLVTFKLEGEDYLLLNGGAETEFKLNPAEIKIDGTINSEAGISIMNGGKEININGTLNANKKGAAPTEIEKIDSKQQYKLAMDDGNGVVIVSQNTAQDRDFLSAIVNLDGKINANGSDVIAQAEIYHLDKDEDASNSLVNAKSNADIQGHDVKLLAYTHADELDHDLLDIGGNTDSWTSILNPAEWGNAIAEDFVHLGEVKTKVTIENGAKINATHDLNANAVAILPIAASSTFPTFAFNYTDVDVVTEAIVKSGANLTAGDDLTVQAFTDFEMTNATMATSLLEIIADTFSPFGHTGAYALTISLVDLINRAVIENGANLHVNNNISVLASMLRNYTGETKNGMLPVIDRNRGAAGIGIGIHDFTATNEAIMNADAEINGSLVVNADYEGSIRQTVSASSAAAGEDGNFGLAGRIAQGILGHGKLTKIFDFLETGKKSRAEAIFNKIQIAGAINVAIDEVVNNALIGDAEKNIKPVIKANNAVVGATLLDNKSQAYALAEADNGETSVSGAVVVNLRNMDSTADVYGDLTLTGSDAGNALIIRSKTDIQHSEGTWDWIKQTLIGFDWWEPSEEDPDLTSVDSANVDDYLKQYGMSDDYQKKIDDAGNKFALVNMINFNDIGLNGLFNTFASSQANAGARDKKTNAWAGAVSVAVTNATSNALLHNGSNVNILNASADDLKRNILIQSDSVSEIWSGSVLMSLFNLTSLFAGMSARDGDSTGGSFSIAVSNIDTAAKIGENVTISGQNSNVSVKAKEDGEFINIGNGSASADNSGLGGDFVVSDVAGGETVASIEKDAVITGAKDVAVKAERDDVYVNAAVAYTNSQNSKSFGISPLIVLNEVNSYIAGNVLASGKVDVTAEYDKIVVNTAANVGFANAGTDNPSFSNLEPGDTDDTELANLEQLSSALDETDLEDVLDSLNNASTKLNSAMFSRPLNPDKQTSAYAGNIVTNIFDSDIKAYIADGATINAGSLNVDATSTDLIVDVGAIVAANGKKGGGATILFDMSKNQIESYIGRAIVDVLGDLTVNAKEEYTMIDIQAGIAQAKDSSGVGNLSVNLQLNEINAGIKEGAKINTNTDNENQSVNVTANLENKAVKVVGALSIQAGGGQGQGGAVGAALDANIYSNDVNAYIEKADVNAGKALNVTADSSAKVISVDVAGAASTGDSAYAGTLGTYISVNDIDAHISDAKINQTESRTNKAAASKVKASSTYNEVAVTGAVAGGKGTAAGGSVRAKIIADDLDSYVNDTVLDTTGSLTMENKADIKSVAVTVAGSVSTSSNALDGAIMAVVDSTSQNNYIENSIINASSVKIDSDNIYKDIGVTGALAVSAAGSAIGGSIYVSVIDNDISTYIKNSDITAQNNIDLTSDINVDSLSIIFAGGGGKGIAASGAISTVVNNSNSDTYIKSEADKKNDISSTDGTITVKGTNDIDIKTINGGISVSVGAAAIGGSINTVVDNNDLFAGVEGINLTSKDDVEVEASSDEDIMSISVGGAGGTGVAISGSVNTMVMASDIGAYIKNSEVKSTSGNVKVTASGDSEITGGTGAISVSVGSAALGGSVVTGVINNEITAEIENSKVEAGNDVVVSAEADETIGEEDKPFITVAGGFSTGVAVEGVIDTFVVNSTADAHIRGTKTIEDEKYGVEAGKDVSVTATGKDTIYSAGGAVSASGSVGVGATVNTIVVDKDTYATAENTKIEAVNISASATETDDFFTTVVAAGGAGSVGVGGVVNTNVITSDVKAGFKDSTLNATGNISAKSEATADMQTITGAIGAAGAVGVGISAVNDVIRYRVDAHADNVEAEFNNLNIEATTDNNYSFDTVSGGVGGTVGVAGVENVNYINNDIKAYATGKLKGNNADIKASDKVTFDNSYSGVISGGGVAGVGATVEVNSVTSTVQAYIGGENVRVNNINVSAKGEQNFDGITVIGFGVGGVAAVAGTALANLVETTVKAYIEDGAKIENDGNTAINSINLTAENKTIMTENVGAVSLSLGGAFGASVGVNKIANTVEAYTGNNVQLNAKNATISAKSENIIGKEGNKLKIISGSAGLYAGVAGSVLYTSIKDTVAAYVGNNNEIKLADYGKLDISATDVSKIYETLGSGGAGLVGVGAAVGYNVIENTVVAYVGTNSVADGEKADVSLSAQSEETVDALGVVIGGGAGALSGGVVYLTIGKQVGNASYNQLNAKDQENFNSAKSQSDKMLSTASNKISGADDAYKDAYNKGLVNAKGEVGADSRINNINNATESLFTKSSAAGSHITGTDRKGTTSAFIDTAANIKAHNLSIEAKNINDTALDANGGAIGLGAIGISAAISDNSTTTNAFISNNVVIDAGNILLSANSEDKQNVDTLAATGGIVGGSGSLAEVSSNKTTNAYILKDAYISTDKDIIIKAESKSDIQTEAKSGAFGAVAVGASIASSSSTGSTSIDIGDGVTLVSKNGQATINTNTKDSVKAVSWAATGGLGAGAAGDSSAKAGKDSTIKIGKNFIADVKGEFNISSNADNYAFTDAEGRAYGGVSAGGTNVKSEINQVSGVRISDADEEKVINAGRIVVSSKADNRAENTTYAGAGALAGFSGSTATNNITSANNVYVGKNYNIATSGEYLLTADTKNEYKGYNKANAFGVVVGSVPSIINNVYSTVSTDTEADITAGSKIVLKAINEIVKKSVSGYDLYGGAGGLASGAGGSINDTLTMFTTTKFGGNKAEAKGDFGDGSIDVSAYNNVSVNEKADLYSHGGIAGADTDSVVKLTADATVEVANKKIKNRDDHINYTARNDVDIYTKVNSESYGGVAGAGGNSEATSSKQTASVVFKEGAKSVSGRDTNISAISNKSLEAYIYAETGGVISIVGGYANAHNKDSEANIVVSSGAEVKSFDRMNINAYSSTQKLRAKRDALAYELGFIPYHGSGNEYTTNNNYSSIVVNGAVESGLGANRTLVIDADGTAHSENDNINISKEQIGSITSADIQVDIQSYTDALSDMETAYNEYIKVEKAQKDNYQTAYNEAKSGKEELEADNATLTTDINNTQAILDKVRGAIIDANDSEDNLIATPEYAEAYGDIEEVQAVIDAFNSGVLLDFEEALLALMNKETELADQINTYNTKIAENNNSIANYEATMTSAENSMNAIDNIISATTSKYSNDSGILQTKINDLKVKKAQAETQAIPVWSMMVDDIVIRSGETRINGAFVTGSGSITAPGNKFTIDITNNSASNIFYGDLIISRDLDGGIYGSTASTITRTIKNPNSGESRISIINTLDKNDPTINFDSNAGDIVLHGNVENPNGSVYLTNYAGNILSDGNLTTKDLHIRVPNGGFNQQYNGQELKIGGASGTGAVVASGDIDIAAKTIDINGLIQSGSEIKEVNIPEFTVIKKDNGKYYQVVGGVETEMVQSATTEGYYYLTLSNDTSDVATLKQIKAYFKPSDKDATNNVPGEIYLFKANVEGGNITLTGNIVSSSNNGKIVMLNGYGHIDIVNNSNYNLVTNALSADTKGQAKLTINDFNFTSNDGGDTFKNLTQSSLTDEFLTANAGKYVAYVGDDGQIVKSSENNITGNGAWGDVSAYIREDGANVYSTTYTPGNDAYVLKSAGGTYSYQAYKPRSWIVELFCGKQYETVTVSYEPTYEVNNNSIAVNFQGFNNPVINITSNGTSDVVLNNNISLIYGDINIKSGGNILTNNPDYVISAHNINLTATNNIGQTLDETLSVIRPVQIEIMNNGKLTATGNDLFINYPYTEISNIDINAAGKAFLSTHSGSFDGADKTVSINANTLELRADNINLDMSTNENIIINVNKLKARAQNDITITNKGNLAISSVVSEYNGTISLESKEGSIVATSTDTYNPYHINSGNIILKALNGSIGALNGELLIARDGIYNVEANGNIYLNSDASMYIDKIKSNAGSLILNSKFGIIASAIEDENRNYHLSSLNDIHISSATGNIENIAINTSGAIYASAGYGYEMVEGLSDINIRNVSDSDMIIGEIKASQNVTLNSNKGIKNASGTDAYISGESVAITALGDVGEKNSAIDIVSNREITVLSKAESNVYLKTENADEDFKVNQIGTHNDHGSLGTVEITSAGNIINASVQSDDNEISNIKAESIKLKTAEGKNIGSADKYFVVDTPSSASYKGLEVQTNKAYIKGKTALNVKDIEVDDSIKLEAQDSITINNANVSHDLYVKAENVDIAEMNVGGNLSANVDNITAKTSNDLHVGIISGNTSHYAENVVLSSENDITNGLTADYINIVAENIDLSAGNSIGADQSFNMHLADNNNVNVEASTLANLYNEGAKANYGKVRANDVIINSENDITIADLDTDTLTLNTKTSGVDITGNVETKGEIKTADKRIVIDNESFDPDYDATAQLHLTQKPMHLVVDSGNNIKTESQNVTRHSINTLVNKEGYATSMEGEITSSVESGMENSYHGEEITDEINTSLSEFPTLSDYVANVLTQIEDSDIKAYDNTTLNSGNIMSIVNQKPANKSKGKKHSSNQKQEKIL